MNGGLRPPLALHKFAVMILHGDAQIYYMLYFRTLLTWSKSSTLYSISEHFHVGTPNLHFWDRWVDWRCLFWDQSIPWSTTPIYSVLEKIQILRMNRFVTFILRPEYPMTPIYSVGKLWKYIFSQIMEYWYSWPMFLRSPNRLVMFFL